MLGKVGRGEVRSAQGFGGGARWWRDDQIEHIGVFVGTARPFRVVNVAASGPIEIHLPNGRHDG